MMPVGAICEYYKDISSGVQENQWVNMLADVEDYVRHRDACQVNKVFCSPCLFLAGGSTSYWTYY